MGIWPPSKPGFVAPPVRALCPLLPFPEVLPRPEPGPRPTRFRDWVDPAAGDRLDRVNCRCCGAAAALERCLEAARLAGPLPRAAAEPFALFFSAISSPA